MSGSVEENSVEAQGVTSPLRRIARLSAPSREAYATTPAEINALALLNQQGGPQMIGYLAGLQSDRTQATDAYRDDLVEVNQQQARLARLADAREGRGQDIRLATSFMNTPNAGSLLQIMQPLFTPEGVREAQRFTSTALAERESKTAENNAQAQRAMREGGGNGRTTDPTVLIARDQNFVNNAVRNDPLARRLADEVTAARQALSRFDPLITANVPAQQAEREAAKAALDRAMAALEARRNAVREEAQARLPQRNAPAQTPQPPAGTPQTPAAAPQAARTDEASPPPMDRIARARANGWTDAQLRVQLAREGLNAEQINEMLRPR